MTARRVRPAKATRRSRSKDNPRERARLATARVAELELLVVQLTASVEENRTLTRAAISAATLAIKTTDELLAECKPIGLFPIAKKEDGATQGD